MSIEAMKLALEALEKLDKVMKRSPDTNTAITALRQAIEQAQQKPVSMQWVAEMIMSDCGCSTNNQRLLERVMARIDQYERANNQPQRQTEQEPVIGTKTWYEDGELITQNLYPRDIYKTSPPQRQPLMDEQGIWVLTSEYNAYDQYGEYFEAVFIGKPTSEQIQKHCHVTELGAAHILSGGGRVEYEDEWYNLRKEEAVYGIKGEV